MLAPLTGNLGVQDNTCEKEGVVEVYLDDQLYKTFNVNPKKLSEDITINTSGANRMSLVFKSFEYDSVINLADTYIK